jgi:acyl carrier protein phosphodiesterase
LVTHNKINIDSFYDHLNNVDDKVLTDFLKKSGSTETDQFFKFLNGFKSSRYLLSYQKLENISYALQRICMRIWAHPFSEETVSLLTGQLQIYKEALAKDYMQIFNDIEKRFEI